VSLPSRPLSTSAPEDVRVLGDEERLRVLALTGLASDTADEPLSRWAQVAAEALATPVSGVSIISANRHFQKALVGVVGWTPAEHDEPLHRSFCSDVVVSGSALAIADLRAAGDPMAGAYAGAPLLVQGQAVGALCVLDERPRAWTPGDLRLLTKLAEGLSREIELHVSETALRRSHSLIAAHNHIHELIARDEPLPVVLGAIVSTIETHDPSLFGSILLVDADTSTLRHGAASRLPASLLQAIDGIAVGAMVGSCGSAAATGRPVLVADVGTDERWTGYRHLVEPLGLRHCWSYPVSGADGSVLGTFAVYGAHPRLPSDADQHFLQDAAKLAGIAIERRHGHDRLVHEATHDPLTGLANRAAALESLRARLAGATPRRGVSVLFIDLDRLKTINDSLGHDVGDEVIRHAALRLQDCVSPDDTLARMGGEEFLVVCGGDVDDAAGLAERILATLRAPIADTGDGTSALTVTASIGIAVVGDAATPARLALHRADLAMYTAKARGGNAFAWSEDGDATVPNRRLRIETELRHAIARGQLAVAYQPVLRFADGGRDGMEALARWTHPELGSVAPDEFIPVAEQTGLIHELGDWVLQRACADWAVLAGEDAPAFTVGINVSARQLRDPRFPARVDDAMSAHGVPGGGLCIEITETSLMGSDDATREVLAALDAMGVPIYVDDFGTGYSSLAILKRHRIAGIKIDRSFVDGIDADDGDDRAIVTALVGMTDGLGIRVVAEGIETQRQYDILAELGCTYAQGYLLGRPVPLPVPVVSRSGP
jgi:diguanylate cyclase (GGDEF)-like protein